MMRLTALFLVGAVSIFAAGCATEDTTGTAVHKGSTGVHEGDGDERGAAASTPGATDTGVAQPVTPADGPMPSTSTTPAADPKPAVQAKPIACATDADSVTQSYRMALQREPDPEGLQNWVAAIQNGDTRLGVLHHILASQEFLEVNANLTDDEFVSFLYHAFFHRDPDAGGRQDWLDALAGGMSRAAVATAFADSDEFKDAKSNPAAACYF